MAAGVMGPRKFYVWMATACAAIAWGGFAGTYWLQLPAGTFDGPSIMHLHGAAFSAWTILLMWQAWLGHRRSLAQHRAWGMVGVVLGVSLIWLGLGVSIHTAIHEPLEQFDAARTFLSVPVTGIALFGVFFLAAVACVRSPEWHKRLMLLSTISILDAAVARVMYLILVESGPGARPGNGPPPPPDLAGEFITDAVPLALMLIGAAYDWRTQGRPHPAWLVGLMAMLAVALFRVYGSTTPQWLAVADGLMAFGR